MTPVIGLSISGIIINTQVTFLNAWVTSLENKFEHILADLGDPEFWICDAFHEISGLTSDIGSSISVIIINNPLIVLNAWVTSLELNF